VALVRAGKLRGPPRLDPLQLSGFNICARHLKIIVGLQVHPELWRISEIQAEPQCGVGSDAPAVVDDLCNTVRRDPNSLRELILGQAVLCQKLLFNISPGVTGANSLSVISISSI
jgi:hypothetical protein